MTALLPTPLTSTWTFAEIAQQPQAWRDMAADLDRRESEVTAFLAPLLAERGRRIVLTGAGTSAFVGKVLAPALACRLGRRVDAVATTDIVADPRSAFVEDVPTLLVSFARSGNSPESLASTRLADQLLTDVRHLVVTCDQDGQLARAHLGHRLSLVLTMPAATNDRGFAMTSSFTSMLLGAWKVLTGELEVDSLAAAADAVLADRRRCADLAARDYQRVVYLGSGAMAGLAEESALKMLELTAGQVVSYHDTALGFRHGPKSVLNDEALVIVFRSVDEHTGRYDDDMITELRAAVGAGDLLTVRLRDGADSSDDQHTWSVSLDRAADVPLAAVSVIIAQLLALHLSVSLGCTPDNPFPAGGVNRVVQGVTIHELTGDDE